MQLNYAQTLPGAVVALIGSGAQTPGTDKLQNVVVRGNYAYVSAGVVTPTLMIFNVSDPTNPYVVGSVSGTGNYLLGIQGNYVYMGGSGSSIFYVVDISNPANPFIRASLTITGGAGAIYGTAISGNYAYLATQSKGLTVVDVTNPGAPVQVYQEGGSLNKSVGVTTQGTLVYTTNFQTSAPWTVRYLKIWNAATPTAPVLLTTYTLPAGSKPEEVRVYGNYAYVSDVNTNSVQIVDITNPLAPSYLASMFASASFNVANNVSVSGNYAYITSGLNATYGGAVDFFDITNKSTPVKVSTTTSNVPTSVFGASFLYNNLLYVADYGVASGNAGFLRVYSTPTAFSAPIYARELLSVSVQLISPLNTAIGVYSLQGSDDASNPSNWSDIPGATGSVSGTGVYLVPVQEVSYQYIRASYTNTGVGGVTMSMKALSL